MLSQENPMRFSSASTGISGSSVAQLVSKDTVHMGSRWCKSLELPKGVGKYCRSGG